MVKLGATEVNILFDWSTRVTIPVILMAALLANVNMFTLLFWSHPVLSTVPILGKEGSWSMAHWFGSYEPGCHLRQEDSHGILPWSMGLVIG